MATVVELTQVQLARETGVAGINGSIGNHWVQGSEKSLSVNQTNIIGVGYFWDDVKEEYINGIVLVYLSPPVISPIVVTDSYATIAGYIAANP